MVVRKGVPDDFNERDFIDLFRHDPKATIFQTESETPPAEPIITSKREPKARRSRMEEYKSTFLNSKDGVANRFSRGKTAIIRAEHHNKIQQIVSVVADKEISITSYLDNILTHHLSHYEAEISEMYNSKNQFKKREK